eukprot:3182621-Prorocentrum_lima.AAC.1
MTSSLVGSEMCIRDRLCIMRHVLYLADFEMQSAADWLLQEFQRPGKRPVSYTHLTLPTICSV